MTDEADPLPIIRLPSPDLETEMCLEIEKAQLRLQAISRWSGNRRFSALDGYLDDFFDRLLAIPGDTPEGSAARWALIEDLRAMSDAIAEVGSDYRRIVVAESALSSDTRPDSEITEPAGSGPTSRTGSGNSS